MDITKFVVSQRDKALLVGDYGLYRKQLSRRLLVVRKKLNIASKGRKYTPKAPVTAEDIASNHESALRKARLLNAPTDYNKIYPSLTSECRASMGAGHAHEVHQCTGF